MIEIDIQCDDVTNKRKLEQVEQAGELLSDLLTKELVKEARRRAPMSERSGITRRKVGRCWKVSARSSAAEPYIEQAALDLDWSKVLRRLQSKVK